MGYEHGGRRGDGLACDHSVSLNPAGPPESIKNALMEAVDKADRYPDADQLKIRDHIASVYGLTCENVICGNGASELIMAVCHMINPGHALLLSPSFYGYEHALKSVGCLIRRYALDERNGFVLDEKILDELTKDIDIFFLCNPNNPTGRAVDHKLLLSIAKRCVENDIYLVLDECFVHMSDKACTLSDLVKCNDRLMIINAFTKIFALPGVRFGYALADPEMIRGLKDTLPEWNVSVFGESMVKEGCRLLHDGDYINGITAFIKKERDYLSEKLSEIGIKVYKSEANFILVYSDINIGDVLATKGICVRDCSNFDSLKEGFYRIAVRSHEENKRMTEVLREELEHRICKA